MDPLHVRQADYELLPTGSDYVRYFRHLRDVFSRLIDHYRELSAGGDREAEHVRRFLDRLLHTVEALRFKYAHHPSHSLKVDLTDSGFPSAMEIAQIGTDLARRDDALRELLPESVLKRKILDRMIRHLEEPTSLLWQLSERTYLEALREWRLMLPFTPGELQKLPPASGRVRSYLLTWACYDFVTSRPYVHLMAFDQDRDAEPLEEHGPAHARLLAMIRGEGSRAPRVAVLAAAIDSALPDIHPKLLKRISIGPLFSRFLVTDRQPSVDPLGRELCELLALHGRCPGDFVLFVDEETVYSRRQVTPPGKNGTREIFHLPDEDADAHTRGASTFARSVLMPHHLLQHVERDASPALRGLDRCKKTVYTEEGDLHGV